MIFLERVAPYSLRIVNTELLRTVTLYGNFAQNPSLSIVLIHVSCELDLKIVKAKVGVKNHFLCSTGKETLFSWLGTVL